MELLKLSNDIYKITFDICPWDTMDEYKNKNEFLKECITDLISKNVSHYIEFIKDWLDVFENDNDKSFYNLMLETISKLEEMEK